MRRLPTPNTQRQLAARVAVPPLVAPDALEERRGARHVAARGARTLERHPHVVQAASERKEASE